MDGYPSLSDDNIYGLRTQSNLTATTTREDTIIIIQIAIIIVKKEISYRNKTKDHSDTLSESSNSGLFIQRIDLKYKIKALLEANGGDKKHSKRGKASYVYVLIICL